MSELLAKGVGRETIDALLTESGETGELARAADALRRRGPRWRGLADHERRQKMQRYLLTRGFRYEVIAAAISASERTER